MSEHRTNDEMAEAIEKLRLQVWYNRTYVPIVNEQKAGRKTLPDAIIKAAQKTLEECIAKYGENQFRTLTTYESGLLTGKLSALRWVLGDEWDHLDT